MAKKKTVLSIEERLQQALVPKEEQPYEVPENWVWVSLGSVLQASKEKADYFTGLDYKYVGLENLEKDNGLIGFTKAGGVKSIKNVFHKGQVLYGKLRPYLNKHDIAPFDGVCSTDILVLDSNTLADNCLINYYMNLPYFIEYAVNNSKGINLPRVSVDVVLNAYFPLPPLPEQRRIVARIEELFAKLDEAKENLQEVLGGFETRKAAILHKAFTGELTKKWREEHGMGMDSWEEKALGCVGKWVGGGTPNTNKLEYWKNGSIPWVTSKDMKSDEINDTILKVNYVGIENSSANLIEQPALLVVMRSGILRRTFPVSMIKIPFTVNQDLKAIIPNNVLLEYLFYACKSNETKILSTCIKNGTTVESINSQALKEFKINLPPLDEQQEIVRLVDSLLEKEQKAKEAAESVLEQIDLMKKSILARAFRGELGTNDPAEPSSMELLKQVLAEAQ